MANFLEDGSQKQLHQPANQSASEKDAKAVGFGDGNGNGQESETGSLNDGQPGPDGTRADGLDQGGNTGNEDSRLDEKHFFFGCYAKDAGDNDRHGDVADKHGQYMLKAQRDGAS